MTLTSEADAEADLDGCIVKLRLLLGQQLLKVRYFECDCKTGVPEWAAAGFDRLDYGFEIDLVNGTTWSFTWAVRSESLLVYPGNLVPNELMETAGASVWDVSSHWLLDRPLVFNSLTAVWEWDPPPQGSSVTALFLVTLMLAADGGRRVVVTLGDSEGPDRAFRHSHDNLAVFFSEPAARMAGVLLPGDPKTITRSVVANH